MASKDFVINILADATKAASSIKSFGTEVDKTTSNWGKLNQGFGAVANTLAGWGVGSALKSFASASTDAYGEAQESAQQLQFALDKFPATADTTADKLMEINGQLEQKTQYDDDALASGQAVLAQYGLTGKQLEDMTPLLADYAAKTGQDIPNAAKSLGMGLMGQTRTLKQVGIDMQDTGSVAGNYSQIMNGLRSQVGGFAEQQGKTAAGTTERLKNNFGELQETVGGMLLPVMTKLSGVGVSAAVWMQQHETLTKGIAITVGVLAAGYSALSVAVGVANGLSAIRTLTMGSETAATTAATGAQTGLNAAMSLNPIMLVVAAIAALTAGLAWFFTQTTTGRKLWADFTGFLGSSITNIRQWFGTAGDWIIGKWHGLLDFFHSIPGAIGAAFGVVSDLITAPFRSAFGSIRTFWNSTLGGKGFDIPDWVPGVGGRSFRIPMLAKGGTITSPGLVMVGERGPEMLSLPTGARVTPLPSGGSGGAAGNRSYSPTYNLYTNDTKLALAEIEARDRRNAVAVPISF